MRECDPKDTLAVRLILARIQMTVNQRSVSETQSLEDVLAGMVAMLKFSTSKSRQRRVSDARRAAANRIALIICGQKEYAKIQMDRIETFACCVEALGLDVKLERDKIQCIRNDVAKEIKKIDDVLAALNDPAVSDEQIKKAAKSIQSSALKERSTSIRDIGKQLYERADRKITASLTADEVVTKIAKALVLPARNDPGTANPV